MEDRDNPILRDLLDKAAELPPADRGSFLNAACGGDQKLGAEVEALLASLDQADGFLNNPTLDPGATEAPTVDSVPVSEGPGSRIGRYKLLQLIGEGGFGSVFMAEQEHPVRRRVALKIIKLGMDTKQVIARFEAERQALAMMDHAHIARVFDAGATDTGRPYFVMELVRGVPITEYCDTQNLSTRERLELFIPVCNAVQHAHQKGIIHRDIKPSNVLVTMADGKPVPKIIDFGIAKATNARLTEQTYFTEFRQFIGTPQYMSPEQAEMSGIDIDTRSDIYSLGVLLYELLTGTTPLDAKELRSQAYEQIRRTIREVEPPRPSTRLSAMGGTAAAIAQHRRTEPHKLGQLLRGELDWIVMRSLEKDRTRRYDTPGSLASDIQRHLDNEPVLARPPSTIYAVQKFVSRHWIGATTGVAVLTALVVGLTLASYGLVRARAEKEGADEARIEAQTQRNIANTERIDRLKEQQEQALDQATAAALSGDEQLTTQAVFDAERKGASQGRIRLLYGLLAWRKEDYAKAEKELEQARKLMPDTVAPIALLSLVYNSSQQLDKCDEMSVLLERVQPQAEEDFLFKGMAESNPDPEVAIASLNTAARMRSSGVVREAREQVLGYRALDTRSSEDAESALADAMFAEAALPGDPNTLATGVRTRLDAAVLYEKMRNGDKEKLMMEAAGKLVEELGAPRYRDSIQCHVSRALFFERTGSSGAARREHEEMVRLKFFDAYVFEAHLLMQAGDVAGAIALASDARTRHINTFTQCSLAMILAESDPSAARAESQTAAARHVGDPDELWPAIALLLLGDKAEAERAFRAVRQRKPHWPWRGEWYARLLDFDCGEITVQQLLARAGASQFDQCEANFHIAMKYLADGDRSQARKHFQASVETGIFFYYEYHWSRTFLARMAQDQNWPRWISISRT